jgi:hypothetical protein
MTDTYHHWQIAWLTQQVGLSHGFRLWDLKGMEYFWGILHPIVLLAGFFLTQSIDILVPRLVSIGFGVLNVLLIFQLCRRYWGRPVAATAAAFAALAPPIVFTDTLGMVEPIAQTFILLGLYCWPSRGFLAGLAWALAAMARAEAWLFGAGLLAASFGRRLSVERRLPLWIGWLLGIGLYMKLLLDQTGNPIYPLYWEFLVEGTGKWMSSVSAVQHQAQPLFLVLLALSAAGIAWSVWRRPPSLLFLSYGFGSTAFVMGLLAFTPFLASWSGWVWRMRLLTSSLEFAAVLAASGLFTMLPRIIGERVRIGSWSLAALSLIAAQLLWLPIHDAYGQTQRTWQADLSTGRYLGALYDQRAHHWGRLNIPADQPTLTYVLARFGQLRGQDIVGQLYDPFYDRPAGYRYDEHPAEAGHLMACWLENTNTSVFVLPASNHNYVAFANDYTRLFKEVGSDRERRWLVLAVISPDAVKAACWGSDGGSQVPIN